jgi:hypothetical protein
MVTWIGKSLALVLVVGLVLVGFILLGRLALESLRPRDRHTVAFGDIDCAPPPGQARADFLDEVQYFGSLPGRLQLLDKGLPERLARGFARHPWVEKVQRVEVVPPGVVRVQLVYRAPVLAVPLAGGLRAVDEHGVLLPSSAPTAGLRVFPGSALPPVGPVGTRWGDAAVEAAAREARRVH